MYFDEAFRNICVVTEDLSYGDDVKREINENKDFLHIVTRLTITLMQKMVTCKNDLDLATSLANSMQTNVLLGVLIGREMGRMEAQEKKLKELLGIKS
jgi:hypothetical protein